MTSNNGGSPASGLIISRHQPAQGRSPGVYLWYLTVPRGSADRWAERRPPLDTSVRACPGRHRRSCGKIGGLDPHGRQRDTSRERAVILGSLLGTRGMTASVWGRMVDARHLRTSPRHGQTSPARCKPPNNEVRPANDESRVADDAVAVHVTRDSVQTTS